MCWIQNIEVVIQGWVLESVQEGGLGWRCWGRYEAGKVGVWVGRGQGLGRGKGLPCRRSMLVTTLPWSFEVCFWSFIWLWSVLVETHTCARACVCVCVLTLTHWFSTDNIYCWQNCWVAYYGPLLWINQTTVAYLATYPLNYRIAAVVLRLMFSNTEILIWVSDDVCVDEYCISSSFVEVSVCLDVRHYVYLVCYKNPFSIPWLLP